MNSALDKLLGRDSVEAAKVTLPHDAMVLQPRSADSAGGGAIGFFTPGNVIYKKNFYVPQEHRGKVIYLEFEGIYLKGMVKVNGEYAGQCTNGYNSYFLRIHDLLHYGEENTVEVVALNTQQPNSRWYSGTGLYRDVKYLVGDALHLVPDGVRVTTIHADENLATIRLEAEIANDSLLVREAHLGFRIKTDGGIIAREGAIKFTIRAGERTTLEQRIFLDDPKLWSPEEPNLYSVELFIEEKDDVLDRDEFKTGIRTLQLDSRKGFRINGKPYKMRGGCIHHDSGVLGAATFADAEERKVVLLKEAGFNAIRSSHNPTSKAMLDACDRHGMMVMDEFTDMWTVSKSSHDYAVDFEAHWEQDVERMIRRDYNHPCVVMYSIGNEIPESGKKITVGIGRKIIHKIRAIDRSRYITNCMNPMFSMADCLPEVLASLSGALTEGSDGDINQLMSDAGEALNAINTHPMVDGVIEDACDMLDVIGYNYAAARYAIDHEKYPDRIFVGSETCSSHLAKNWKEVTEHPYVLGDFNWTALDYLGEAGLGKVDYAENPEGVYGGYPWKTGWCGDLDIVGNRRPVSYWRQTVWGSRGHEPYIAVQRPDRYGMTAMPSIWAFTDSYASWNWPGFEGKGIVVEAYADAEELELLINGVSQGRKTVGEQGREFTCEWDTNYTPGTVTVIAYINGEEVGKHELNTAGAPRICLKAERETLQSGSNDLCFVRIELRDEHGVLNTGDDRLVELKLEGPASIQGAGSADPVSEENFYDKAHKTFFGQSIVVLRAGEEKGTARLTVSSDGMESVSVEVEIQ